MPDRERGHSQSATGSHSRPALVRQRMYQPETPSLAASLVSSRAPTRAGLSTTNASWPLTRHLARRDPTWPRLRRSRGNGAHDLVGQKPDEPYGGGTRPLVGEAGRST